jgi:hypothetical protein
MKKDGGFITRPTQKKKNTAGLNQKRIIALLESIFEAVIIYRSRSHPCVPSAGSGTGVVFFFNRAGSYQKKRQTFSIGLPF